MTESTAHPDSRVDRTPLSAPALVTLHAASMLSAAALSIVATAGGDRGEGLAVLAFALPTVAALLLPFAARAKRPRAAKAAVLLSALPYALALGWLQRGFVMYVPIAHRSSVPIGEPNPLAPLLLALLAPVLGAAIMGVCLGPLARRLERTSARRNVLPEGATPRYAPGTRTALLFGLAALSSLAATFTLGRPTADEWLEAQPIVAEITPTPGRSLRRVDATHVVEAYSRGADWSDELHLRTVPPQLDLAELEAALPPCNGPDGDSTGACGRSIWVHRGPVPLRHHDPLLLVGAHALMPDGAEVDLHPRDIASEIALPLPLVLGAWFGLLLAAWTVFQARSATEVGPPSGPLRALLGGARGFALLLLVFTQAPLVAAYLCGALS